MKWALLTVIVVSTVLGDVLQSYEMKRSGAQQVTARGLAQLVATVVQRKFLILAILFMALSFFAFMALLQRAPSSYAVPASAATFVCETVLAKFVLKEAVGKRRASGALLVMAGVVLLAR